jgi:hypothetical protein
MRSLVTSIFFLSIVVVSLAGCATERKPTQEPDVVVSTPIPGYVAGEEDEAYASFIDYYSSEIGDCDFEANNTGLYTSIDKAYKGRAVYVGDGVWRFYISIEWYDTTTEEVSYSERMVEANALPDRTWNDVCNMDVYFWDPAEDKAEMYDGMSEP